MINSKKIKQSGQILLIILLIMLVGLTIGLSLTTRSVEDLQMSTQLEESAVAFAAAEAGIEAALEGQAPGTYQLGNANFTFTIGEAGSSENSLPLGKIGIADTYTLWLTSHNNDGELQIGEDFDYDGETVDLCWDKGAIEIMIVYQENGTYKVKRGAYDPNSERRTLNYFSNTDEGINCGGDFNYGKRINLPSAVLIALRIRPFYSEANIAVAPATGYRLPSQGLVITATGTSGETTRRVSVIQSYPSLPAIFDYVLFSGTTISK